MPPQTLRDIILSVEHSTGIHVAPSDGARMPGSMAWHGAAYPAMCAARGTGAEPSHRMAVKRCELGAAATLVT